MDVITSDNNNRQYTEGTEANQCQSFIKDDLRRANTSYNTIYDLTWTSNVNHLLPRFSTATLISNCIAI